VSSERRAAVVGAREYRYQVCEDWLQIPAGIQLGEVVGVGVDSRERVYVVNNRSDDRVLVFNPRGEFLASWGRGWLVRPHGIFIGSDDTVYCPDMETHTVQKFSADGMPLSVLGEKGTPSDTGAVCLNPRTVKRAGPPFNRPTNVALGRDGSIYVSDGYGNARMHKFSPKGELLLSWGSPGSGPGEFCLPHGVVVDEDDHVYVADRENNRIQIFTANGEYLSQWTDCSQPCQIAVDEQGTFYVAELSPPGGRVSIYNRRGEVQARWEVGGSEPRVGAHGICLTPKGDLYVGFVTQGAPVEECVVFLKYARQA
jgi:DNA-binding beta-propeller fold protein YncE